MIASIKILFKFQAMSKDWPSWAPTNDFPHFRKMGYGLTFCPKFLIKFIARRVLGDIYLPVVMDAPFKRPPPGNRNKYKLIVFSHGIGCAKFFYSHMCADLASYGYVVVAIEHRDGSACRTRTYDPSAGFFRSKDNILDFFTRGWLTNVDEYDLRHQQVKKRAVELIKMLGLMQDVNAGNGIRNVIREGYYGEHKNIKPHPNFRWGAFKDAIAVNIPIVMGHSFGGATALMATAMHSRFHLTIVLDGWMFPVKDYHFEELAKPILFINAESFRSEENLMHQRRFAHSQYGMLRKCCYIRGSVHQNHLDVAVCMAKNPIVGEIVGMLSVIDPVLFQKINTNLILDFILQTLENEEDESVKEVLQVHDKKIEWGFDILALTMKEHQEYVNATRDRKDELDMMLNEDRRECRYQRLAEERNARERRELRLRRLREEDDRMFNERMEALIANREQNRREQREMEERLARIAYPPELQGDGLAILNYMREKHEREQRERRERGETVEENQGEQEQIEESE